MPLKIAIVGAECTGKSTLARALASKLKSCTGEHWQIVDEYLREWCDAMQRTPAQHEQLAIAREQSRRIEQSALHGHVIADTTALMTAVYSHALFTDGSLLAPALELQRAFSLTLVTVPEFEWCAGDWQRDGPQVQQRVHAALVAALTDGQQDFLICRGTVDERVQVVLKALQLPTEAPNA